MTLYEYTEFYIYDKDGTWVNNTDTFEEGGVTYTVTAQTAGPFGYVRDLQWNNFDSCKRCWIC